MSAASLIKSGNPYYPTLTGASIGALDVKTMTAATIAATTSVTAPLLAATTNVTAPIVTAATSVTAPAVVSSVSLTLPGVAPLVLTESKTDLAVVQIYGGPVVGTGTMYLRRIGNWVDLMFSQSTAIVNATGAGNITLPTAIPVGYLPAVTAPATTISFPVTLQVAAAVNVQGFFVINAATGAVVITSPTTPFVNLQPGGLLTAVGVSYRAA